MTVEVADGAVIDAVLGDELARVSVFQLCSVVEGLESSDYLPQLTFNVLKTDTHKCSGCLVVDDSGRSFVSYLRNCTLTKLTTAAGGPRQR